jgi:hypothetical protein
MSNKYISFYGHFYQNELNRITYNVFQTTFVESNSSKLFHSKNKDSNSYLFFEESTIPKERLIKVSLVDIEPENHEDFGMAGFNITFRYFNKERQDYEEIEYYISPYDLGDTCDILRMDNYLIKDNSPRLLDYVFQFDFDEIYSSIEKLIDIHIEDTLVSKSSIDIDLMQRICKELSEKIDRSWSNQKAMCSFSLKLDTINRILNTKIKEQKSKEKIKRESYLNLKSSGEDYNKFSGRYSIQFKNKIIIISTMPIKMSNKDKFMDFDLEDNKIKEFDDYIDSKLIEMKVIEDE